MFVQLQGQIHEPLDTSYIIGLVITKAKAFLTLQRISSILHVFKTESFLYGINGVRLQWYDNTIDYFTGPSATLKPTATAKEL